jgi:hypothetical protein
MPKLCIPLLTDSVNGNVIQRMFADRCLIIKFAKSAAADTPSHDLLQQDALIMKAIQSAAIRFQKHSFLTPVQGQYVVEFSENNVYVSQDPDTQRPCVLEDFLLSDTLDPRLAQFCLTTYGVTSPLALNTMHRQAHNKIDTFGSMMIELNRFLKNMMTFASLTGFSHGDMHVGNVLWDERERRFVLIDYGRAYIHPAWVPYTALNEPAMQKSLQSALDRQHVYKNVYRTYNIKGVDYPIMSYFTKRTPEDANTEEKASFMMSLDIAGMCFYLYEHHTSFVQRLYPHANTLYPIEFTNRGDIKSLQCHKELLARHSPIDMFDMGLHTFYCMMASLDPNEVCDKQGHVMWEKIVQHGVLYPAGMVIGPDVAQAYYNHTFGTTHSGGKTKRTAGGAVITGKRSVRQRVLVDLSEAEKAANPWEVVYRTKAVLTPQTPLMTRAGIFKGKSLIKDRSLRTLLHTSTPAHNYNHTHARPIPRIVPAATMRASKS